VNQVRCCIAGCGPAGAVLGLLLARAGIPVVVLEKHADFLRDFRGDTIHPSTLEILDDLGLADRFLSELPHSEVRQLQMRLANGARFGLDFRGLPSRFKFIAFVPQWDFLDFVVSEAKRYPTFNLLMETEVSDLLLENGQVAGVRYRDRAGASQEIRALLTVGADGRSSRVREAAGLPRLETAPPMDVLWFRVSRRNEDAESAELRLMPGHFFVVINRRDYWQVAYLIPKGTYERVRAAGLEAFRHSFVEGVPELADRSGEIQDWDQIKLLTVRADRLRRWYRAGLLCIGDAAHAMSPIGGVGINVAIQDAVETANLLWRPLARGTISTRDLARVQRRRELPVRLTQAVQGLLQDRVLRPVLGGDARSNGMPWAIGLALQLPLVKDLPGRFVGMGVMAPRVKSPSAAPRR
jgi:2-polyprenyl-6-methoxyphenol hydroxylase-like FAD-dependent oxidoreductase